MKEITNLRMANYYSMSEGLLSVDDVINHAIVNGQSTVSITNRGRMISIIDFYQKARSKGLKPIVGLDAFIENDVTKKENKTSRILLLAKNESGYKELMKLSTRADEENLIGGDPAIKESWLQNGVKNVIALSGEDVNNLFFDGFENREELTKEEMIALLNEKAYYINQYKNYFPDGFFLEIMRTGRKQEDNFVATMLNLSVKTGVPIVATQSAKYKSPEAYSDHIVRSALGLSEYVAPKAAKEEFGRGQYLLSSKEMNELFSDLPFALDHANSISKMLNLKINLGLDSLPQYPTPNGESADEYLKILASKGLEKKLIEYFPNEKEREFHRKEYTDRMNFELDVIKNKNFSNYFLIVSDVVDYAISNKISVGIGRGSAVGSLVTTLIGITNVNPIEHGLYFERFLNPERVSMPDIDVDFPSRDRKKIANYMINKYNNEDGEIKVAQIGTYNTFKIKGALNAVIKSLDVNYEIAKIARNSVLNFEKTHKDIDINKINFDDIMKADQQFKIDVEDNPDLKSLIRYVNSNIGIPSSLSKHASGIVVSSKPLTEFTPLTKDNENQYSTLYDKDELESVGLIKFDILGLNNLDFTEDIVKKINERPDFKNKPFDLNVIDYKDPQVFDIYKTANTGGIFQFESEQMKKVLSKIQADNLNDVIAVNALIRPGPNQYIDLYADRKLNGTKINYIHPLMEQVTSYTQGILIYQEQVMQAAKLIAGYSLGEAELLRKAMGKKNLDVMKAQKEKFINNAKSIHNISNEDATKIFEDIESFAGYGFNKAHAVAYSLISYKNAYFKRYYPKEFFLTLLEHTPKKNLNKVLTDIYKNDFKLVSPDINNCKANFSFNENREIVYGLADIKELNEVIANKILKSRKEHGEFKDIYDFCERVGREDLSQRLFVNMINAGCFDKLDPQYDSIEEKRSLLLANAENLINYTAANSRVKKEKGFILSDLFGAEGLFKYANKPYEVDFDPVERPEIKIPTDEEGQELDYLLSENEITEKETDVLGVCLSIDPLDKFKNKIKGLNLDTKLIDMNDMLTNNKLFYGVIMDKKELKTKKGKDFMIIKILDGTTTQDLTVFDERKIEKVKRIKLGDFISVKKYTNEKGYNNIDEIRDLEETKHFLSKKLNVAINSNSIPELIKILEKHKGSKEAVIFTPELKTNSYSMLTLPMKINITKELENDLVELLGDKKFISFELYSHYRYPDPKKKIDYKNENKNKNWQNRIRNKML